MKYHISLFFLMCIFQELPFTHRCIHQKQQRRFSFSLLRLLLSNEMERKWYCSTVYYCMCMLYFFQYPAPFKLFTWSHSRAKKCVISVYQASLPLDITCVFPYATSYLDFIEFNTNQTALNLPLDGSKLGIVESFG